ncbi:MAG: hypothetical protein R3F40_12770 [Candidatus Competibacteraceae bacterium]
MAKSKAGRKIKCRSYKNDSVFISRNAPELLQRANQFSQLGLKKMDALHLACAVTAKADAFLTTDKSILKKAAVVQSVRIQDPIDFIRELFS